MDKFGVLWTRYGGTARKLADMVLTPKELRITKHPEAIAAKLPGVSLLHDKLGISTVVYQRDQWHHLPPQLEALLPPAQRDNPQRVILSHLLARQQEIRGLPVVEQEWAMLLFAGRNGIGHLEAFANDEQATHYYQNIQSLMTQAPQANIPNQSASALWAAFRRIAEQTANDVDEIAEIIATVGATPAISGFNPKLFVGLQLAADVGNNAGQQGIGWDGELALHTGLPAIVKVESSRYPGLLALEALAYDVHRRAGLPCPRTWWREITVKGEEFPILAIERFDRDHQGHPLPVESVYSLLRTGAPRKFYANTDGTMEDVWQALQFVSYTAQQDRLNLYSRFALALLTGNGDLHLENWSVLGMSNMAHLSPVYDPAPMRAYRAFRANHDLLSALPFNGIGGTGGLPYANSSDIPPDLGNKLQQFGQHLGLSRARCRHRLAELLDLSQDYPSQAIALLESIPKNRRSPNAPDIQGFAKTLQAIRESLAKT